MFPPGCLLIGWKITLIYHLNEGSKLTNSDFVFHFPSGAFTAFGKGNRTILETLGCMLFDSCRITHIYLYCNETEQVMQLELKLQHAYVIILYFVKQ